MLEAAYTATVKARGKLLSPIDREYVELLLEMNETDRAKEFVQKLYDEKKSGPSEHLLSPTEREYVELLIKLGDTEKAKVMVESAYEETQGGEEDPDLLEL
jgi:hypothetical protein